MIYLIFVQHKKLRMQITGGSK